MTEEQIEIIKKNLKEGWSIHVACNKAGTCYSTLHRLSKKSQKYKDILDLRLVDWTKQEPHATISERPQSNILHQRPTDPV